MQVVSGKLGGTAKGRAYCVFCGPTQKSPDNKQEAQSANPVAKSCHIIQNIQITKIARLFSPSVAMRKWRVLLIPTFAETPKILRVAGGIAARQDSARPADMDLRGLSCR
jgi:hypothetical protein